MPYKLQAASEAIFCGQLSLARPTFQAVSPSLQVLLFFFFSSAVVAKKKPWPATFRLVSNLLRLLL